MLALVLNAGSNSLKFDLMEADPRQRYPSEGRRLLSGAVEDIGKEKPFRTLDGRTENVQAGSYADAAKLALESLRDSKEQPELIVHRVVHGGDEFPGPARVDPTVMESIARWKDFAPLHNGPAMDVIRGASEGFGNIPAVAVFDTSFHRTLPETAYTYALPAELASRLKIRRYGFHGVSHRYQMLRYAELRGVPAESLKLITLHLESGSSAAAIAHGRSVDTSMGFTPLEGLVMGGRCGDIDPAIPQYLAQKLGLSSKEVDHILNKESGLLGISGISGDTRVLMKHLGEPRARLALEVFAYRVLHYVGAYLAVLGGADAIVFSGGIGENTPIVRKLVCDGLQWCGVSVEEERNETVTAGDQRLSEDSSGIDVWAIHSDEAAMLAHEGVIFWASNG